MPQPQKPSRARVPRPNVAGTDAQDQAAQAAAVQAPEQIPQARDQTASQVDWQRLRAQLGQPGDLRQVPLNQLLAMREDPMISFGMHYQKVPLARSQWHIEAEDTNGPNAQVAGFLDRAWRMIHARYVLQATTDLEFGYAGIVKRFQQMNPGGIYVDPNGNSVPIWDNGTILPWVWQTFVNLSPDRITPIFDDTTGQFNGINYEQPATAQRARGTGIGGRRQQGSQTGQEIDVYHALWTTNERDAAFGSLYGRPRIRHAYYYWWSYWWRWQMYDRAFERLAIPPIVAFHPPGDYTDPETNETMPYQEIALNMAERLRANAIAAVPSTMATSGALEGGSATQREWDFKYLEIQGDPFKSFEGAFSYLDVMKLRSVWVPEQAFIEGEGGTSSRNVAAQMAEIFIESQGLKWDELADVINNYIFPQLLVVNFPDFVNNGGHARIVGHGFSQDDVDLLKQIVQLVGQADPTLLGVDIRAALQRLNVPMLPLAEFQRQQSQLAAQQANGSPPPLQGGRGRLSIVPNPNKQGSALGGATNGGSVRQPNAPGTGTLAGFADEPDYVYMQPSEYIELSDAEEFLTGLPSTKHYSDKAIKALALQLWRAWEGHFRNLYPSFANHVGANNSFEFEDLDLEMDDKQAVTKKNAEKIARRLVNSFFDTNELFSSVRDRSRQIMQRMLKRSGRLEQANAGVKFDSTKGEDAYNQFLDQQIGKLVKRTSDSTRRQLRQFLIPLIRDGKNPQEIADSIRDHFGDFSVGRASSIARSETRDAVNASTLITGQLADLKYTRATDGDGDPDCRDMDGKLLTIREAWKALRDEHPNGTRAFQLIPRADFSIEYVTDMPDEHVRQVAYFDDESSTAFILEDAPPQDVSQFLVKLADRLTHKQWLEDMEVLVA